MPNLVQTGAFKSYHNMPMGRGTALPLADRNKLTQWCEFYNGTDKHRTTGAPMGPFDSLGFVYALASEWGKVETESKTVLQAHALSLGQLAFASFKVGTVFVCVGGV